MRHHLTALIAVVFSAVAICVFASPLSGIWAAEGLRGKWVQLNLERGNSNNGFRIAASELRGLREALQSKQVRVLFTVLRQAGKLVLNGEIGDDGDRASGKFEFEESPGFRAKMAAYGYTNLSSRDIYQMAVLDVTTELIDDLNSLGYRGLTKEELIEMRIFNVDREFITALQAAGYSDVPQEKLVEMSIHGATPEYIREMAELGFNNLSTDRLVEFRIHGVSPEFVRSIRAEGYENVSAKELVEMRIFGVDSDFIQEARAHKNDPSVRELINMRIFRH